MTHEVRFQGTILEDHRDNRAGVIRYIIDGMESTIEYQGNQVNNKVSLYSGDKVIENPRKTNKILNVLLFRWNLH